MVVGLVEEEMVTVLMVVAKQVVGSLAVDDSGEGRTAAAGLVLAVGG